MAGWKETDIGTIPSDWDVGVFERDLTVKGRIGWMGYTTSDLVGEGPLVVGGSEIKSSIFLNLENAQHLRRQKYEESPEIKLKDGDVLLVTRGNLGAVGYFRAEYGEATINPSVIILKDFQGNSKFLFYYLISRQGQNNVLSLSSGSSVPAIYQAHVKQLKYPKPQIAEQESIGKFFYSIDAKIDLLRRENTTLEALAETLFRQWFVEEAEDGWEKGTIEDEFDFTMGQSPSGSALNEDGKGMVFFQGRTDFGFRFPEPRIFTTEPTRLAKKFDTLVSVRAPVGDMNLALEDCCLGRGVAAFRYRDDGSFRSYTYYKMRSLMAQIKQFEDSGTVFGSIGKDDFKNLENVVPPRHLVERFQRAGSALDEKIYENTIHIRTLTQMRDTLLPKLMNGEMRLKI